MADFVVNGDMFGRYVRIQTDYSKAMHTYKVVARVDSNYYCDVPVLVSIEPTIHAKCVPVLKVIHCGIDESKIERVALSDCELIPTVDAEPVRRGKWIETHEAKEINGHMLFGDGVKCSCCDEHGDGRCYCSNCGARMDEVEQ